MRKEMTCDYSSTLAFAASLARRADPHPSRVKGKMVSITIIFLIGLVGAVLSFQTIVTGLVESEQARLLTTFLLLGSLAVMLASGVAVVVVSFSALIYQYIEALDAKQEVSEVTEELKELATLVAKIRHDLKLEKEFELLVAKELRGVLPCVKGNATAEFNKVIHNKRLGVKISRCISDYLEESGEVGYLIKMAGEQLHAT